MTRWFKDQFLLSKHLYNQTRYIIKNEPKFPKNTEIEHKLKSYQDDFNNYRKLCKAKVSQMIVLRCLNDYKTFFKTLKAYNKNKSAFNGEPKPPKYKERLNALYFDYQSIKIKDQFIVINKDVKIHIPDLVFREELKNFKTINFFPRYNKIKVSISYESEELNSDLNKDEFMSIDLGMNNLCSCVSSEDCFIINGKPLKSINQFYNKKVSKLKSERPVKSDKQDFNYNKKKIDCLSFKRSKKIDDFLHKASKHIVSFCVSHKIGTLVVGRNKGWKDSIRLGKKTNQNFVTIPFYKLLKMLEYKCRKVGINLALQEESYTSKCDSLAFEKIGFHDDDKYKGERIKRGLFKSSIGKIINADINGALNILRKYLKEVDEFSVIQKIIDRGLILRPYIINVN